MASNKLRSVEQASELPKTLSLTRSQAISIQALINDERRLNQQLQEAQTALEATFKARGEVVAEIGATHNLAADEIGANYQFDGKQLLLKE